MFSPHNQPIFITLILLIASGCLIDSLVAESTLTTESTPTNTSKSRIGRQEVLSSGLSKKDTYRPYDSKFGYGGDIEFPKSDHNYGYGSFGKGRLLGAPGGLHHGKSFGKPLYGHKPYATDHSYPSGYKDGYAYGDGRFGKKYEKHLDHGKLDKDHGDYEKAVVYKGHGKKHYEYDSLKDGFDHKTSGAAYHNKFASGGSPYHNNYDYEYGHKYDKDYNYGRPHGYTGHGPHSGKFIKASEEGHHSKDFGAKDYEREKYEDTVVENKFFSEKVRDSHLHDHHSHLGKDKVAHNTGVRGYNHKHHGYPDRNQHGYGDVAYDGHSSKLGHGYGSHGKPYVKDVDPGYLYTRYDDYNKVYPQKAKSPIKLVPTSD